MKKKVNKNPNPGLDKFDRKQKNQNSPKSKSSKRKLSIYDEFDEDEEFLDYSSPFEFFDD